MGEWTLAYGPGKLEVLLPAGLEVGVLLPPNSRPLADPAQAIRQALRQPLGCPPLAELVQPGDRVCIVLSDRTRVTGHAVFLPVLLEEIFRCTASVPDVIFASGAHRPMTPGEMVAALGPLAGAVTFAAHDATGDCRYLGHTGRGTPVRINSRALAADHLILTGKVVHHAFAGFGGGPKALFPGLAALASIEANHRLMLEPGAAVGIREGNPLYEDLAEAAALARPRFLLNTLLDPQGRLTGVFAGEVAAAHRAACASAARSCEVAIDGLADLVLAGAGGHPLDIDLYQSQKALENACRAVRPGGVVILAAACPDGAGNAAFERWVREYRTPAALTAALARRFELGGHKAWGLARLTGRATVVLVSELEPETVRAFGLEPAASIAAAITRGRAIAGGRPSVYLLPAAGITVPMPRDPARPGGPGPARH